jgi:hypothetical protein
LDFFVSNTYLYSMKENKKLTKTLVIRITEDQYRKLRDSVKRIPKNNQDTLLNKSKIIREMMDKYLVPNIS